MATTKKKVPSYRSAATGEEGRFFAGLSGVVPLSETIKRIDYRFGEDSDNKAAVWITIYANPDANPSKDKIAELNQASEKLRSAILNSGHGRWPYVQIKTD